MHHKALSSSFYTLFDRLYERLNTAGYRPEDVESWKAISGVLNEIFENLKDHLPANKKINIASLGSGLASEYIPLLAFYKQKGIEIDYTGIDIDEKLNTKVTSIHSEFKSNFRILNGDASHPLAVKKLLEHNKCLPKDGFDLVILRHPDLTNPNRIHLFLSMISDVIPFITKDNARVFMSCYHQQEINALANATQHTGCYYKPGNKNFVALEVGGQVFVDDIALTPDQFSTVMRCDGQGFKQLLSRKSNAELGSLLSKLSLYRQDIPLLTVASSELTERVAAGKASIRLTPLGETLLREFPLEAEHKSPSTINQKK